MARIRSIKPEFWTSEQIAECSTNARLMFIGIWNFSDDYGVSPASLHRLKTQIFPSDTFSKSEISKWIDELIAAELLVEYEVRGSKFWFVTGWDKHQKPESRTGLYPRPDGTVGQKIRRKRDEHTANIRRNNTEHSTNVRQPFAQGEGEGEGEGKGEGKGNGKGDGEGEHFAPPSSIVGGTSEPIIQNEAEFLKALNRVTCFSPHDRIIIGRWVELGVTPEDVAKAVKAKGKTNIAYLANIVTEFALKRKSGAHASLEEWAETANDEH